MKFSSVEAAEQLSADKNILIAYEKSETSN
jgi:hypothetical protein